VSTPAVADVLWRLRGVWHDHLEAFTPDGTPLHDDDVGSVRGPFPFDNLVYIDFDGRRYRQTNVTFRGRPVHVRTFSGRMVDGLLVFDPLGERDPGHVGVACGPDTIAFVPRVIDDRLQHYSEPDVIRLDGDRRVRTTVLWRDSVVSRTLHVTGRRVAASTATRFADDPRGPGSNVHADGLRTTTAFRGGHDG
jgi:hypothetical protein